MYKTNPQHTTHCVTCQCTRSVNKIGGTIHKIKTNNTSHEQIRFNRQRGRILIVTENSQTHTEYLQINAHTYIHNISTGI